MSLGDVRPYGVRVAEPFLLLVAEDLGSTVGIAWSATSTRVDARQEGVLSLSTGGKALTPLNLVPPALSDAMTTYD